ncbi:MAG: hypothetical protein WB985_14240 [Candidatus Acidiferrales bacterium]
MRAFTWLHRNYFLGLAAILCLSTAPAQCQEKSADKPAAAPAQAAPATPEAKPADVASPDAILAATYEVISGPPGERDWNRFYSLFLPEARLVATGTSKKDGTQYIKSITPEGYSKMAGAYFLKNGFFEREIARKAERYGNIMQIFSTYESRNTAADEKPFARGINSFQLYFDGKRWWVVTIFWEEESQATPIPKEYLPQ